jgi:hypothetical protein
MPTPLIKGVKRRGGRASSRLRCANLASQLGRGCHSGRAGSRAQADASPAERGEVVRITRSPAATTASVNGRLDRVRTAENVAPAEASEAPWAGSTDGHAARRAELDADGLERGRA